MSTLAKTAEMDCTHCGVRFSRQRYETDRMWAQRKFCTTKCAYAARKGTRLGSDHPSWKGGRTVDTTGYVRVRMSSDHRFAAMRMQHGYVQEHRLVMAEHIGRALYAYETVHHRNGEPQDNRIENLELRVGRHGKGAALCCADCGSRNLIPADEWCD